MTPSIDIPYKKLAEAVKKAFLDQDKYKLDKYVPEFKLNDKYFADCFNTTIVEPLGDTPPIFYHTYSPYDIVSKKAPNQALVLQNGNVILNTDFTSYIPRRTGVMSPLVLQALGHDTLKGKLLIIGTGRIAQQALRAIKDLFPDTTAAAFINTAGDDPTFVAFAKTLGIAVTPSDLKSIGQYNYIICHSSAQSPVLTTELKNSIKPGAFIASFVSENFCELADEYYDTSNVNAIIDWDQTIQHAADLQRAVNKKIADPAKIIRLKDLLSGAKTVDQSKSYTVYRSHGTPMQDLAVLKLLLTANRSS